MKSHFDSMRAHGTRKCSHLPIREIHFQADIDFNTFSYKKEYSFEIELAVSSVAHQRRT